VRGRNIASAVKKAAKQRLLAKPSAALVKGNEPKLSIQTIKRGAEVKPDKLAHAMGRRGDCLKKAGYKNGSDRTRISRTSKKTVANCRAALSVRSCLSLNHRLMEKPATA